MLLRLVFLKFIIVAQLLLVAEFSSAQEWKMPLATDKKHFQTSLALRFAREVKQSTKGRVSIRVYPAGKLFKGEQIFGAVSSDLVPIGARLMSALARDSLLLQVDALPFLAKSYLDAFNLYKVSKPQIEEMLAIKGVKLLYAIPWPAQGLYSVINLTTLAQLKGLKFRPYNELTAAFGERLGLSPVIMPVDKLVKSLKKKKIDLLFGSTLLAGQLPLRGYFNYWYDIKAWRPKEMVVVNLQQWRSLSEEDRLLVMSVAKKVESRGWVESKQAAEQARLSLSNQGIEVAFLPSEMQGKIESIGHSLVRQWLDKIGDPGRYLLERYNRR